MIHGPAPRKSKADIAAKRLKVAIVNRELKPELLLGKADLSEMLGLGRTPVREALLRLSSENLVQLSRAGVLIPPLNAITMLKLLELREPLERVCIQEAAERQTAEDRDRLSENLRRLEPLSVTDRDGSCRSRFPDQGAD